MQSVNWFYNGFVRVPGPAVSRIVKFPLQSEVNEDSSCQIRTHRNCKGNEQNQGQMCKSLESKIAANSYEAGGNLRLCPRLFVVVSYEIVCIVLFCFLTKINDGGYRIMARSVVFTVLSGLMLVSSLLGCTTPQERKAQAEARGAEAKAAFEEERLKMLRAYNDCLKKEGPQGAKNCEHLKGAVGN